MENTETKVCSKCGESKSLSFYREDTNICKKCNVEYWKIRRNNNKEKYNAARNKRVIKWKHYIDNTNDTKVCKTCGEEKHVKEYDYSHNQCKKCILEKNRKYHNENKEKAAIRGRISYIKNLKSRLLYDAKRRANKRNLPFDITIDDIVIPDTCPILGVELEVGEKTISQSSPTLDKIIPKKGYVKGNVRVISHRANLVKSNGNAEEHRKIAEYIEKNSPIDNEDYSI